MRGALLQPFDTRMDDRLRRIEVRLADFQMDDAAALTFQLRGTAQHFKCGLAAYSLHPFCDPVFRIYPQSVDSLAN